MRPLSVLVPCVETILSIKGILLSSTCVNMVLKKATKSQLRQPQSKLLRHLLDLQVVDLFFLVSFIAHTINAGSNLVVLGGKG